MSSVDLAQNQSKKNERSMANLLHSPTKKYFGFGLRIDPTKKVAGQIKAHEVSRPPTPRQSRCR
jgi:hypothetical protein